MIGSLHTLYAVNDVDNSNLIDGITEQRLDTGIEELLEIGDGKMDPEYLAVSIQDPRMDFTTSQLTKALADISGPSLVGISTGLDFYFQKMANKGERAGAASHMKLRMGNGLFYPKSIQASQRGIARISMQAVPVWDGTNNPFVISTGQSLAGSPQLTELFTVGPVYINGAQLTGIKDIRVDFGIDILAEDAEGDYWNTYACLAERRPSIMITSVDVLSLSTFGLAGTAQGGTSSKIYFRKIAATSGLRVANTTEEHVQVQVYAGRIQVTELNASGGGKDAARSMVRITPINDGSNATIGIDLTAAIGA